MADFPASLVKEVRERSGAGMMDCKNALVEAQGDVEKALEIIQKKGLAKAVKKAGRVASEGLLRAHVLENGQVGALVEVNSETDFVARNPEFRSFVVEVAKLGANLPAGAAEALDAGLRAAVMASGKSVEQARTDMVAKIGENLQIRRLARWNVEAGKHGLIRAYVHANDKIGVLVELQAGTAEAAKNADTAAFADELTLQIAGMKAEYVHRSEIPSDLVEKQKEIFRAQLEGEEKPKPRAQWDKIIEGKVTKWTAEICLLGQESIITSGKTIDELRAELGKKLGTTLEVKRMIRWELGEGIEKKKEDYAAEIAKAAAGG